jgi:hypothetical protein
MTRDGRLPVALGVGLGLALLVAIMAPSAVGSPTEVALGGGGGDFNALAWTFWRAAHGGGSRHPDLLWPDGAVLPLVALPQAWLVAPVTRLLGPVAAVNLVQLLHIALAGGLATAWARDRGVAPGAAAVAGVTFGLSPVLMASVHNGNPDVTPLFWLPLAGLVARRAARSWAWAAAAGAVVGLAAGWSPYAGVMAGVVAAVSVEEVRAGWPRLVLAGLVAGLGLAAWAGWYAGAGDAMVVKRAATPVLPGAAGLRGFLDFRAVGGGADGWTVHRWYLGLVPVALAALAVARTPRRAVRPLLLVLAGGVLALGPALQWHGAPVEVGGMRIGLPGALLLRVPGLDGLRLVWRFAALASLGVAGLAAAGAEHVPGRPLRALVQALLLADLAFLGGAMADALPGAARDDGSCALLAGRDAGPVLTLPFDHDETALLGQTCHGMPVAAGINRTPPAAVRGALQAGPDALAGLGVRWLVLRTDAPGPGGEEAAGWAAQLAEQVVAEAGATVLVDLGARR